MFTTYIVVTILAAAANIFSATLDFIRYKPILINMAKVGVSESWITTLGILKAAGALGLLIGIRVPAVESPLPPVNFHNNSRALLLLVAGSKDHLAPASLVKANFTLYRGSKTETGYHEFPEATHAGISRKDWQTVADYALESALSRNQRRI